MSTPLNIPKIRKMIRDHHKRYLGNFGKQLAQINLDHIYILSRVTAKIEGVIECLKEENVVSFVQTIEAEKDHKRFLISSEGMAKQVLVVTDGVTILVKPFQDDDGGLVKEDHKVFRNVYADVFDWEDFALQLLDYIHLVIYERKVASEYKLNNLLNND